MKDHSRQHTPASQRHRCFLHAVVDEDGNAATDFEEHGGPVADAGDGEGGHVGKGVGAGGEFVEGGEEEEGGGEGAG